VESGPAHARHRELPSFSRLGILRARSWRPAPTTGQSSARRSDAPRPPPDSTATTKPYRVLLGDGERRAPAGRARVVIASGVEYRRLAVENCRRFEGAASLRRHTEESAAVRGRGDGHRRRWPTRGARRMFCGDPPPEARAPCYSLGAAWRDDVTLTCQPHRTHRG